MMIYFKSLVRYYLVFFISCSCFLRVGAQDPYAINYTTKDGLPTNTIYDCLEASNGVMFFGTDAGLVSFDGVRWNVYENIASKNTNISNLIEDQYGRIWGQNFANQLLCFEEDSLHLDTIWENYETRLKMVSMGFYLGKLYINSAKDDNRTSGWIYDLETNKIIEKEYCYYTTAEAVFYLGGEAIRKEQDGILSEISCPDCFYSKTGKSQVSSVRMTSAKDNTVFYFYHNLKNNLFYNRNGMITSQESIPYVFQLIGDTLYPKYFPENIADYHYFIKIVNLLILDPNRIALATSKGLLFWDLEQNKIEKYFSNSFVSNLVKDTEGGYWVTTIENGIFYIENFSSKKYGQNPNSSQGVSAMVSHDSSSNILLGYTNGDIEYLDIAAKKRIFYKNSADKKPIRLMKLDQSSNNYLYEYNNGVHCLNTSTLTSTKVLANRITDVILHGNNVLTANSTGGYIKNIKKEVLADLPNAWTVNLDSTVDIGYGYRKWLYHLSPNHARGYTVLAEGSQDSLEAVWLATVDGIRCIQEGQKNYSLKDALGQEIIVKSFLFERENTFWMGGQSGLYKVVDRKIVAHYTKENGLVSNIISRLKWHNGKIWGLVDGGVFRLDPLTEKIECYTKKNNVIPIDRVCDFDFVEDKLFMTNKEDFISINLPIAIKETNSQLNIEHVLINDSIEISEHQNNSLNYFQNNIKITFRGIVYSHQANFKYKYRLKGLEQSWNYNESNNNSVNYPSLPSGVYTFEVMLVTPDGEESERAVFAFKIKKPYYQEWWFYGICIVLGGGGLWLQFRYRLRKIERENKKELEAVQLQQALRLSELKAIKAQLNPHFIFNALNSIQDYIITNNREVASDYLGKFADLMRMYLNHSQEKEVSLEEELEALGLYLELESIRFEDDFSFEIQIGDEVDEYEMYIPVMLLQPYVENAIRHGIFHQKGPKKISISFDLSATDSNLLVISIIDNGIGRTASGIINQKRSSKHKSFATSANQTRLDLINYERQKKVRLDVFDLENPTGTQVVLEIPL